VRTLAVLAAVVYLSGSMAVYPTFDYHGEPPVTDNRWVADVVRNPVVQALAMLSAILSGTVPVVTMEMKL